MIGQITARKGREATGTDELVRIQVKLNGEGPSRWAQIDLPQKAARRFTVGRAVKVELKTVYNRP